MRYFSPVVKISSICMVLRLAANLDLEVEQMNVKTTLLHGDLDEEIIWSIYKALKFEGKGNYVCKLNKSLYGLKQTPKQWVHEVWFFYESTGLQEDSFR